MGLDDEIKNEAEEAKGKAKEWVGDKTDDEQLEEEGMTEKAKTKAKQVGEHVKDAVQEAKETFGR